jgi:hypothetical protein
MTDLFILAVGICLLRASTPSRRIGPCVHICAYMVSWSFQAAINDVKPTVMTDGRSIVISILFTPGPLVDDREIHVAG